LFRFDDDDVDVYWLMTPLVFLFLILLPGADKKGGKKNEKGGKKEKDGGKSSSKNVAPPVDVIASFTPNADEQEALCTTVRHYVS